MNREPKTMLLDDMPYVLVDGDVVQPFDYMYRLDDPSEILDKETVEVEDPPEADVIDYVMRHVYAKEEELRTLGLDEAEIYKRVYADYVKAVKELEDEWGIKATTRSIPSPDAPWNPNKGGYE